MRGVGAAVFLLALLTADGVSAFDGVCEHGSAYSERCTWNSYCQDYSEDLQLEDRSDATLSVDAGCLQLLVNSLDHPTCPLEDLPEETIGRRDQCHEQLLHVLSLGSPHVPVISHLAYTQRVNVNLCHLAWMVASTCVTCHDIPSTTSQSVRGARSILDSAAYQSHADSNTTVAICSASRTILSLNCHNFSSHHFLELCDGSTDRCRRYSTGVTPHREDVQRTEKLLTYKLSLHSAIFKYKNFKIDRLKNWEVSFISVNILFRILTAVVYMYLPHLRNLPGKIHFSFQITGIIRIFCSEVLYRSTGSPDLSTMVQLDTSLALLGCMWLNSFCYQMYTSIRDLRPPDDLTPAEANKIFCCQLLIVLIPWSLVCTASVALENTSVYYLFHSRMIFIVGISISVAFNMVFLGKVWYMFLESYMRQLQFPSNDKFASKKQIIFLSFRILMLSGVGTIIRIGLHQVQGIADYVHYVHIATMLEGPLLFFFFVCNDTTYPQLKSKILAWWSPEKISAE